MEFNVKIDSEYVNNWYQTITEIKAQLDEMNPDGKERQTLLDENNSTPFIDYMYDDIDEFYIKHKNQKDAIENLLIVITNILEIEELDKGIFEKFNDIITK